jgi:lysophospholipase L1-like esterase
MSCSGSTTVHLLKGGQFFQGPQIAAVDTSTRLVTITSGGNDVNYIGDLMTSSGANGRLGWLLNTKTAPLAQRDFAAVTQNLMLIVLQIRRQAPHAKIMLITYPAILPHSGTCNALGISSEQAVLSREVGARLADATRKAAEMSGAVLVDIATMSIGHDACSATPWVNGAFPLDGVAFHPNRQGASAVAQQVLKSSS